MSLTSSVKVSANATLTVTGDLATASWPLNYATSLSLASGTGTGKADKVWADTRTVTTGATDTIDLAGSLTDPFGASLTFVKVKAIVVKAAAANTTTLAVGPDGTNGFQGPFADLDNSVTLTAGNVFVVTNTGAGWTVTAGTGDLLTVVNSAGASATYDIIVIGASA